MDELLGTSNIKQGLGAVGYLTGGLITREAAGEASLSFMHPEGEDAAAPGAPVDS